MGFLLHGASVIGPGHIASGQPNQDAILIRHWNNSWLAVVSDGMGSRSHSDLGSRCVCRAVLAAVKSLSFDVSDKDFIRFIYRCWLSLLGDTSADDAVATCLIAWGASSGETRLFQLGDGAVIYNGCDRGVLISRADSAFGNETTGLGVSHKYSDWCCRKILLSSERNAIALLTDGISDDVDDSAGFLEYTAMQLRTKGSRYGKNWILKQLEDWPTPAHTDDKTMALIQRI
jgi:serine/threonine protein phosphatase PrpC